VGRARLRKLALIAAAASLATASLAIFLPSSRWAGGDEPPPDKPFLTVHGPNDGEPLNNSVELLLEVAFGSRAHVLVYQGNRYLFSIVVPGQGVQTVRIPIDSTYFPNGPLALSFYLFNEEMDQLVSSAWYENKVSNPKLEVVTQGEGGNVLFKLRGRPGDTTYQLDAGRSLEDLKRPPQSPGLPRAVESVGQGTFDPADGAADGAAAAGETAEIVLNVDNLIQTQTVNGFVILWTYNPKTQWAYSMPLPLKSLFVPTVNLHSTQGKNPNPTNYRR